MLYSELIHLLSGSQKKDRKAYFERLQVSERNKTLRIHKDYYDGIHWNVDESGRANTTRSGKLIWGKISSYDGSSNDKLARKKLRGNQISFHDGQLQTHNYVKLFTQFYQDFVLGSDDQLVKVEWIDGEVGGGDEEGVTSNVEQIQDTLDKLWVDSNAYIKEQIARFVISTVGVQSIGYVDGVYSVDIEDAEFCAPIYKGDASIGFMKFYTIDGIEANALYNVDADQDDKVSFVDLYYPDENDVYVNTKVVDGKIVGTVVMPDELQFNPFDFVANLDHPYRKYDEKSLEDSEIFNWIDRNDALNSNETIEFVSNQYLAMPKISVDWDSAEKMGVKVSDPAIQQALENFQYFPGSIDSLPIKLVDGKTIPDSFYKGKNTIVDSLFEDAGIPRFFVSSEGMSNVAEGTVKLGMRALVRKVSQKRDKIILLMKMGSMKVLKAEGLVDPNMDVRSLPIRVELPELDDTDVVSMVNVLVQAVQNGIISQEYATEVFLELTDREEDLERIVSEKQAGLDALRADIAKSRLSARSEVKAEQELVKKENTKNELDKTNAEIEALS